MQIVPAEVSVRRTVLIVLLALPALAEEKPRAKVVQEADRIVVRKRTVIDFNDVTVEGELPDDERPRPGGRVLLVGIVWGGSTLVELEQVGDGADLSVSRLFDLPESTLPRNFHLVKHAPDGHVVTLPDELHAEVHRGGRVLPLAVKGRRVDAPFRGYAHAI